MPKVSNIESFHSGLHPSFQYIHSLDLGEVLGSGSFGDVYTCNSINGSCPSFPQVIKILRDDGTDTDKRGFDTIRKLQQQIIEGNERRIAAQRPRLESLPALRALPQFSFRGEMDGHQVLGYSATRLDTEGYITFAKIVGMETDTELLELYSALSMDERMLLAAEMTEGFQALSEISFIHADINSPNLLVDIGRCHIAIIDYDSGAVKNDQPTTCGKRDNWMAPEIKEKIRQGIDARADHLTDRWAVFIGIHHLLFLGPPLFFFNYYITNDSVGTYLQDNRWPYINPDYPLFNQQIESFYFDYLHDFDNLPDALKEELSATMNKGFFNPGERTSYQQWALTLRAALRGPEIICFTASRDSVIAGMPTRLTWSVSGAYQVILDNSIGAVDPDSFLDLYLTQTCVYTLTACSRRDESVSQRLVIRVWPLPELRLIQIPTCSVDQRFSLRVLPSSLSQLNLPVKLDVGIHIMEPFLKANATAGFESARARMPKRFPGFQPLRELRFMAIFNQLKNTISELVGAI